MELGNSIREIRKSSGLSQRSLAAKAGVAVGTIVSIEKHGVVPSRQVMNRIATGLGVSKEYILWYGIEERDVAPEKREAFKMLKPAMDALFSELNQEGGEKS